jgi:hypothetical protein
MPSTGEVKYRAHLIDDLENAKETLIGSHFGKLVVWPDDEKRFKNGDADKKIERFDLPFGKAFRRDG